MDPSLKASATLLLGRHSFRKDPRCSSYLLQVFIIIIIINKSFLLPTFALVVSIGWPPPPPERQIQHSDNNGNSPLPWLSPGSFFSMFNGLVLSISWLIYFSKSCYKGRDEEGL